MSLIIGGYFYSMQAKKKNVSTFLSDHHKVK